MRWLINWLDRWHARVPPLPSNVSNYWLACRRRLHEESDLDAF